MPAAGRGDHDLARIKHCKESMFRCLPVFFLLCGSLPAEPLEISTDQTYNAVRHLHVLETSQAVPFCVARRLSAFSQRHDPHLPCRNTDIFRLYRSPSIRSL